MDTRIEKQDTTKDFLTEDLLWGAPQSSDAMFLVSMRAKLNHQPMGLSVSSRKATLAFGLAAFLLVGVWYPGSTGGADYALEITSLDETMDELAYDESDPSELADFLGVSENFDDITFDNDMSFAGVSTTELLELEQQELDTILSELQETDFF